MQSSNLKAQNHSLKFKIFLINTAALFVCAVASEKVYFRDENQPLAIGFGQILGEISPPAIDFALLGIQPPPYFVESSYQPSVPDVTAAAVLILDRVSHEMLYKKNSRQKLPVASLTKLMTAVVALENLPLDEVVAIQNPADNGSKMGLVNGEKIRIEDLIWGLLLSSGNDAAYALMEEGNRRMETSFIQTMNEKAQFLGMQNTHFVNPSGLDQANHYSTAYDLALLTDYVLRFPLIDKTVATPKTTVTSTDGKIVHELKSTNELLGRIEGVTGVKTGTSQRAGDSLILLVERGGHEIIIVLLGSRERWAEGKALIDWVFKNFRWE